MARPAATIRAAVQAAHPGATVVARGRRWIKHQLGPNTFRCDASIGPLHREDEATEIDTDWQATTGAWQWQMTGDDYQAFALSTFGLTDVYRYQVGAEWVEFQPNTLDWTNTVDNRQPISQPQTVVGSITGGDVLRWTNGFGAGRHFELQTQPGRLQKRLVVDSLAALAGTRPSGAVSLQIEFVITKSAGVAEWVNGVEWDRTTRVSTATEIEYRTSQGQRLFHLEVPKAWDAAGANIDGEMVVRRAGPNRYISIRFPEAWVDGATYPIVIDPTITNQTIGAGSDDATENSSGVVALTSTTSNTVDATNEWFGARWDISTIAASSTINSCTVTQEYTSAAQDEPDHPMYFQRASAPTTFTTTTNDISGRTLTTASVTWSSTNLGSTGNGTPGNGTDFTSPSLVTPLQEVVDNHAPLTAVAWILNGSADGNRDHGAISMYEGSTSLCSRLSITWTESGGGRTVLNTRSHPLGVEVGMGWRMPH